MLEIIVIRIGSDIDPLKVRINCLLVVSSKSSYPVKLQLLVYLNTNIYIRYENCHKSYC